MEMVDSEDDLKSSCSVGGIRMPDFEVLDAKTTSALNRIIQSGGTRGPKTGPFPSRKTDCLHDL